MSRRYQEDPVSKLSKNALFVILILSRTKLGCQMACNVLGTTPTRKPTAIKTKTAVIGKETLELDMESFTGVRLRDSRIVVDSSNFS